MEIDLALDPGSSQLRLIERVSGAIAEHPSVCAQDDPMVRASTSGLTAATQMDHGLIRPLRAGRVTHRAAAARIFGKAFAEHLGPLRAGPTVLLAMPGGLDSHSQAQLTGLVRSAGAREVIPVPASILAAWGCELPVNEPVGSLVLDVGAEKTTAAMTSLGGLIGEVNAPVGGRHMDKAISAWVRKHMNLAMGRRTAEALKIRLSAERTGVAATLSLRGRDVDTRELRQSTVAASGIAAAIAGVNEMVADVVRKVLASAPPEVSADISERGIMVCGGSGAATGLTEALRETTGLAVVHTERPDHALARGAALAMREPAILERIIGLSL